MSIYRRFFIPGGTFFFTVVTERRAPLFERELARDVFGNVLRICQRRWPFESIALVLLPDHLHALWTLPPGDDDYAIRWGWVKRRFTLDWLKAIDGDSPRADSRARERRRSVWQRRFWEHAIRDERDLESHFDYIHFNPVKHGYVTSPRDWPWSTFHKYVASGHYPADWAKGPPNELPGNAGE